MAVINCLSCFILLLSYSVGQSDSAEGIFPGEGLSAFIVNGNAAADAKFPWQLSFQRRENGRWFHTCGATLIHEQFALTASHCVFNRYEKNKAGKYEGYRISDMRVVAGANRISPLENDADIHRIIGAVTPRGLSVFFDVALLKLRFPANTSRPDIQAIEIANGTDDTLGRLCSVTGWGTVNRDEPKFTPRLREAAMRLVPFGDCRGTGWNIAPVQTCARGVRQGATACYGDSGGPLSCTRDDGTPVLVGVSSLVYRRCEVSRPNIFAKVSIYRNWIRRMTQIDDL